MKKLSDKQFLKRIESLTIPCTHIECKYCKNFKWLDSHDYKYMDCFHNNIDKIKARKMKKILLKRKRK